MNTVTISQFKQLAEKHGLQLWYDNIVKTPCQYCNAEAMNVWFSFGGDVDSIDPLTAENLAITLHDDTAIDETYCAISFLELDFTRAGALDFVLDNCEYYDVCLPQNLIDMINAIFDILEA